MVIKFFFFLVTLIAGASSYGSERFTVQDIKIEGLQRVTLGGAVPKILIRPGDEVVQSDISDMIRSLYASGHFKDIKVFRDKTVLIIRVQERPTISDISFSGNKVINDEQIKKNLESFGIRVGKLLNPTRVTSFKEVLEGIYYSLGKYNVTAKVIVTPLLHNRVDLKFILREGVSARVRGINFIGNRCFSDEELASKFDLETRSLSHWKLLSHDKYQRQSLSKDLKGLSSFYLERGYLKFRINSVQVSLSPDKKNVYITLDVNEGEQYRVKGIQFKGNLISEKGNFDVLNPFQSGDIYRESLMKHFEESTKKILGEAGYAYPVVKVSYEFDDENRELLIVVYVDPGKKVYVRSIAFRGNMLTKDEVIRREILQTEGAWLNLRAIKSSQVRLDHLGFFETVDTKMIPIPGKEDQIDLVYNVKEISPGSMNFGVGYGTESGSSFQVGLQQDNFLGTGNKVGVSIITNDYSKNLTLSYTDPYWTPEGVSLGGRIFCNSYKSGNEGVVDYTNDRYGAGLTIGFPLGEINRFSLGLDYTHNGISDLAPHSHIEKFLSSQGTDFSTSKVAFSTDDLEVNLAWTRKGLDRNYFPTAGNYQRAYYEMTVPGSKNQWLKVQYHFRQYMPLTRSRDFVLLLRGDLGYGKGYGNTGENENLYPFYEHFYAGGLSTLRGFSANTVGPRIVYKGFSDSNNGTLHGSYEPAGGNAIISASVELIIPNPFVSRGSKNRIRTSIFCDTASLWDTEFDHAMTGANYGNEWYYDYSDPNNYRSSVGVAAQWLSPIGPLFFTLAKPIKKYQGDDEELFSFSIGQAL